MRPAARTHSAASQSPCCTRAVERTCLLLKPATQAASRPHFACARVVERSLALPFAVIANLHGFWLINNPDLSDEALGN